MCCAGKYPYAASHSKFWFEAPPPSYFPLKIWHLSSPLPDNVQIAFYRVDGDIFWNFIICFVMSLFV